MQATNCSLRMRDSVATDCLAATCGNATLEVYARPGGDPGTGDELVPVEAEPAPGRFATRMRHAAAMVAVAAASRGFCPGQPTRQKPLTPRWPRRAGRSAADLRRRFGGKFDLVEPALARMGARFHFTGVNIQPASRWCLGVAAKRATRSSRAKLRSSACRQSVSSAVTFLLFATPCWLRWRQLGVRRALCAGAAGRRL